MRGTRNPDGVFAYLKATNAGRTPDDVLRALADGMAEMEKEVAALAAVVMPRWKRANAWQLSVPGADAFVDCRIVNLPGGGDLAATIRM